MNQQGDKSTADVGNPYADFILKQPINLTVEEATKLEDLKIADPDEYLKEKEAITKQHMDNRKGAITKIAETTKQSTVTAKMDAFKLLTGIELTGEVIAQIPPVWMKQYADDKLTAEEFAGKIAKFNRVEEHNPLKGYKPPNLSTAGGGALPQTGVKFDENFYSQTIM